MSPFLNLEYIFYLIYSFFTEPFSGPGVAPGGSFDKTLFVIKGILWFIALVVGAANIYFLYKQNEVQLLMQKKLQKTTEANATPAMAKNREWERLKGMVDGDNPAEWKLAILDADKMLEALVYQLGFDGDTLGERLKNADTSRMTTLESAWEAHKIRNRIAHEPNHVLTKREARKALVLFEQVFREFGLV